MKGCYFYILLLLTIFSFTAQGQVWDDHLFNDCSSPAEMQLLKSWPPDSVSPASLLQMLLIAEGMEDPMQRAVFYGQFNLMTEKLSGKIKPNHSPQKKAKNIFKYLHKQVLKKYQLDAAFSDVFRSGKYNCLTATALFYMTAEKFSLPVDIYLTPTHVYSVLETDDRKYIIELTSPKKGFDHDDDQEEYIRYLLEYKLISEAELAAKGAAQIYNEYIEERRKIAPELLVPTTYNNIFAFSLQKDNFDSSFCAIRKAAFLDPGSNKYRHSYQKTLLGVVGSNASRSSNFWGEIVKSLAFFRESQELVEPLWELAYAVAHDAIDTHRDYSGAIDMLDMLKAQVPVDSLNRRKISELEKYVLSSRVQQLYRRGMYEESYAILRPLYSAYPEDERLVDGMLDLGIKYAYYLADRGKISEAAVIMDSLRSDFDAFPIVKEAYVNIIMRHIADDMMAGSNYPMVEEWLLRALDVDPANLTIMEALPRVYHYWGMQKVRENRLWEARRIIKKGLGIARTDQQLKEDLEQVENAIAFEREMQQDKRNKK